ncbi:MAG: leucine--tRNA ligase [Candidatus Shapirobacteria bacterium]|jgi:leucyl-tRNA synthetase
MAEENKFKEIESKWQDYWNKNPDLYSAKDNSDKPKKYVLVEFPYPSGSGLHIGHAFSFTGGDVYARFKRMQGNNVMFPMGWDAFGLPTENHAIKMKRRPQEVTKENTDNFREEMKKLAFSFDWSREVNTTDPDYYKWTQWIFIKLFEKGLAYKQEMPINWCPSCKIGLANEEVIDNKCERCGAEVSRRNISQWVVKITDYADRLIDGLKETDFIEKVKQAQINWIGRSQGARIKFQVKSLSSLSSVRKLEVFTTRADTLWGVTFMVISPEHPFVASLLKSKVIKLESLKAVEDYVNQARKKSDLERAELQKEKTGVFTGVYVVNPANGKEIPLYVADYVLMGYGTGVVMGVPAHDQRDWDFAKKYNLEVIPVIEDGGHDYVKEAMVSVDKGKMINSGFATGMEVKEAINKVNEWVEKEGIGERTNMYHLRDWIFSRQHYWGEPIPMIFCESCAKNQNLESRIKNQEENRKKINAGWYPVPEEQLPIKLPEVEAYEPTDTGESPLAKMTDWVKTTCPKCGGEAKRETDTMPNWAGSDWYFLRYCDPVNDTELASQEKIKYWMPVDVYVGGDEHNTLHLLYSRFIYNFLFDLEVVPTPEPYKIRMSHGVILGPDSQRMSKSRGNVVVPSVVADKYGVDVLRLYLMFMGPFDSTMVWNEKTVMGAKRFLDRFAQFIKIQFSIFNETVESSKEVKVIINKLVAGVTRDLESFGYNTAIAKLMEALHKFSKSNFQFSIEDIKTLIKLLAPLAPYTAEELWSQVRDKDDDDVSVHVAPWPRVEEKYLVEETVTMPVMVNGKVREQIVVDRSSIVDKKKIVKMAKEKEKIKKWLEECEILKEIYVPGKLVNFVVSTK